MHHDKNTSINQASSSALNSLGKGERQPLQPRLCVPQNTVESIARAHGAPTTHQV